MPQDDVALELTFRTPLEEPGLTTVVKNPEVEEPQVYSIPLSPALLPWVFRDEAPPFRSQDALLLLAGVELPEKPASVTPCQSSSPQPRE